MLNKLFKQFELRPEQPALFIGDKFHSYADLGRRVNALRDVIDAHYADSGRLVAVVDHGDLDTYAAVLAALCAGHAYVPINPRNPVARSVSVLQQTEATLLFDSQATVMHELVAGLPLVVTIASANVESGPIIALRPRNVPTDSLAYVLFTSGSTGTPKGVPITRRNLEAFLTGLFEIVALQPDDRVLQMFDLTFDFSVMSLFAPLVVGACVYPAAAGEHRFKSVYRLLDEHDITCAPMVPSVLNFLRTYFDDIRLASLRSAVFCGEALLADVTNEWSRCAPQMQVFNFYGPTEATVFCSCYEWRQDHVKQVNGALSIGKAMSNASMFVIDDFGVLAPVGVAGELCISGEQLTPGYWRDTEKTAAAFFEIEVAGNRVRAYRTGDSAYVDADGDFMYLGRLDNQVKVQGFRIELAEIEHHARACADLSQVAAINLTIPSGMVEIVLCVSGLQGTTRALQEALRCHLPSYMVPARVATFAELPLNNNGKVDRPALRRLVSSQVD